MAKTGVSAYFCNIDIAELWQLIFFFHFFPSKSWQ